MNHFIELELAFGSGNKVEINSMFIESITEIKSERETYTSIRTFSGKEHDVKESPKKIKELINTKKITYFNQQQ